MMKKLLRDLASTRFRRMAEAVDCEGEVDHADDAAKASRNQYSSVSERQQVAVYFLQSWML